jgi:predicted transcriptional regulator
MSASSTIREEAHRLVDQLPDDASWEDLIDRIYLRQAIEAGLEDAEAGRTVPVEEVRRRFGLSS